MSCRFDSSQGNSTLHEVAYGFDLLEMRPIKGQVVELLVDFGAAVEDLDSVSRSMHALAVWSCLVGFLALSSAVMRTRCTTSLHVRNVLRTESSGILVYNLAALGGPSRPRDRM